MAARKGGCDSGSEHRGTNPGANNIFKYLRRKYTDPIHPGYRAPRSFNGVIEAKKSAEWWNVINDKKRDWTDGPKYQES